MYSSMHQVGSSDTTLYVVFLLNQVSVGRAVMMNCVGHQHWGNDKLDTIPD